MLHLSFEKFPSELTRTSADRLRIVRLRLRVTYSLQLPTNLMKENNLKQTHESKHYDFVGTKDHKELLAHVT